MLNIRTNDKKPQLYFLCSTILIKASSQDPARVFEAEPLGIEHDLVFWIYVFVMVICV